MNVRRQTNTGSTPITVLPGALVVALLVCNVHAQAVPPLFVDFDGGDTTGYDVLSSSGDFTPAVEPGGPTGNFLRLSTLTPSNNNSVALTEVEAVSGPAPDGKILSWGFRMSPDVANTDAGGCCDSAAHGFGIGYFAASAYGATGPVNPAADTGVEWERPAIPAAAVIGFDVFQNTDIVTLNFGGTEMTEVDVQPLGLDLNNGIFHRGMFTVRPNPADTTKSFFSIDIIEDVYGANPIAHKVLDDFPMDFDLSTIGPNRVIAGARTGEAFVNVDLDNISVRLIPEPMSATLVATASLGLLMTCRRRLRQGLVKI